MLLSDYPPELQRALSGVAFGCNLLVLALWIYLLVRTRLAFLWFYALSSFIALLWTTANLVLAYDLTQLGSLYHLCDAQYISFAYLQWSGLVFGTIGSILLFRWLLRWHSASGASKI